MSKITQALHQVMSSVSYIQKTGKNSFHGYNYAGEADLLDKLRPAMLEAGLILLPSVRDVSPIDEYGVTTVRMEYTLVHKDGEVWPHPICAAGQGGDKNKNGVGDKGLYKAITGANKYLLFKLFQIETGDDPESDSTHESTPQEIIKRDDGIQILTVDAQRPIFSELEKEILKHDVVDELKRWKISARGRASRLSGSWLEALNSIYLKQLRQLEARDAGEYIERMTG